MTTTTTTLTIEQGIVRHDRSREDIAMIEDLLLAAGADFAKTIPTDRYVGFWNADGHAVAYLYRSFITITNRAIEQPAEYDRLSSEHIEVGGRDIFLSNWEDGSSIGSQPAVTAPVLPVHPTKPAPEVCYVDNCSLWSRKNGLCLTHQRRHG